MDWIGYILKLDEKTNYLRRVFLILAIITPVFIMNISPVEAGPFIKNHDTASGDMKDPECSGCHTKGQIEKPKIVSDSKNKPVIKESVYTSNINSAASSQDNYTAILEIGQNPYQLGPFFRSGLNGWSWWDTNGYGTENQKNLISIMVFDNTGGTIKPVTGLTSPPSWPQASYRNHSGNFSYKADRASSPLITRTNYSDQVDILMVKEVDLSGYSNANLTFYTWYSMETDWDYGYVGVSINGISWSYLPGTLSRNTDPNGNNLGNGVTGNTNGSWIRETMDLTQYAGNKILIGFRFMSDSAYNDEGWYVDDINITSGTTIIFYDDAETPVIIRKLSVNVTYPHLSLTNIMDPLTDATTLQYEQRMQQVNVQEDPSHPGTYSGYFKYETFGEQYSGIYTVILDTIINDYRVKGYKQFQTTIFGCQGCHNQIGSGIETSFIHSEGGGWTSCMYFCHGGSRGFYGGSPSLMGHPLSLNPMHVHEMQYGHNGGFLPGLYYPQPPYNVSSHVNTTTCSQCHTSFLHDNTGTDSVNIGSYALYGTNINFSSGVHKNLSCEFCHGSLVYPVIPQSQYQLQGRLGNHSPSFTSHGAFTDTYIIAVNGTDNLSITTQGENTNESIELFVAGPVDNSTTGLQGPCDGYPCDIIQGLETPIHMNIAQPYAGTWLVNVIKLQESPINYSISSNYPLQAKPIIKIPECNSCHNVQGSGNATTNYQIPDWNPGFAHVDTNHDGTSDVQCRMCHDAIHDIIVEYCQVCHIKSPTNHPISDPSFSKYTQTQCLSCHGDPHRVTGLPDMGYINGTVIDNFGDFVPGATIITNTGISAKSLSNGSYYLALGIDNYQLMASLEPGYFANNSVNVTAQASITVTQDIILIKKQMGTISGSVRSQ